MSSRSQRTLSSIGVVAVSGIFHAGVALALGMVPPPERRAPEAAPKFIEMAPLPPAEEPPRVEEPPPPPPELPPPPEPKLTKKPRPVPVEDAPAAPDASPEADRKVDRPSDEVAELSVASVQGGLAVQGRAGDGRAGAVSGARVADAPVGEAPPVDLRALKRAYAPALHRALRPTIEPLALLLKRRRQAVEGETIIGVEVDANGVFTRVWVKTSCGEPSIDEAAVAEVRRVGRAEPPPAPLAGESFSIPYKWKLISR